MWKLIDKEKLIDNRWISVKRDKVEFKSEETDGLEVVKGELLEETGYSVLHRIQNANEALKGLGYEL